MISLILPYWQRQEAADAALGLLSQHYYGMELEIIVVDDGNEVPFKVPAHMPNVRVVTLPRKDEPKAISNCYNAGVAAARGDVIALSCIEVLHVEPVLEQMAEALAELGPKGYVLAAAWCPEHGEWHCHSSRHPPQCAPGTGATFLAMMNRSLYQAAGGFDERYRDGAGYEDCDFINRLLVAGAEFVIRDDLKVIHPKAGAQIEWGAEKFERNRALYEKLWPVVPQGRHVTFVCLKAGTQYGPEYVNTLHDMVTRNLPEGIPGRFVCITDDPTGLDPRIGLIPLPRDLERWWGKLFMFERGLFPDGSRMIFMDLDTVIVGSLARLAAYRGQFATLRDFVTGNRVGPAVIAWEAGEYAASIWEEWDAQGRPRNPGGDLWWINQLDQGRFAKNADKLQDLYPGDFVSFKVHCDPMFPKGAKVVCFHGEPRPHNCGVDWVANCWKVGGGTAAEMVALCNTRRDRIIANIRSALARGLPELESAEAHLGHAVIVGGGPSLKDCLRELTWRAASGQTIFALNGAGKWLIGNGIEPQHLVILDARPENAGFMIPAHCFLASHCDPGVFDAAKSATVYHVNTDGIVEAMDGRQADLISTGSTVGMVAMGIAYYLGFRHLHLFGFDSSYAECGEHHAYAQPLNDEESIINATAGGRTFKCAPWMVHQVQQFQSLAAQLAEEGCVITVAGDGLLPHVARQMGNQLEAA